MKKLYKAAIYGRLSRDDGDNLESESITNQRNFIKNYISNQDQIILIDEYFDDGYTGGNFDRPSWQKLMKDIKDKKINTIITKDLSRMGRDYISMGEYIERIFPEKNIRYIAINDDIDTLYETPGLDYLQFKLMFNDFYIKDGSKKIRKIIKNKKEHGQYTGWKGIYGYKRDPHDKHKLIIDENVKDIVVRMFNLAKKGYGPKYIADLFSLEGIPNPSTYAHLIRGTKSITSSLWCDRTIGELLENPTYIGNLTQGRRKKVSYKSKKEIRVPKEEWIIVKNTHEPIIDEETFNTVQEVLKKNKNNQQNKNKHLLKGFLYCKDCNHTIGIITSKDKKRNYCICNYYLSHSKFKVCTPHSINYDKLENIILNELRKIYKEYINDFALKNKINKELVKTNIKDKLLKEINYLDIKIKQIINYLDESYLDKLENKIDIEQYNRITIKFKKELAKITIQKKDLSQKLERINKENNNKENEEILTRIDEFLFLKKPPRELLVNLIDRITITEDKTIEINYKFKLS